ncbi:polysaccharide biosynthesis/export family protein [Novosphingobium lentum]|uniref:polysaccharide biosynthesis/export family protein n=1 Tax=Novosphingobium lentum TaxID=145287 RepID=UPI001FE104E6|nr:polysaccharide biosynthesis/export family protein [Novosphingobium lentum]
MAGCTTLGSTGPTTGKVLHADQTPIGSSVIRVVNVDSATTSRLIEADKAPLFSDVLAKATPVSTVVGRGDVLEISVVEAPPAVLFNGTSGGESALRNSLGGANVSAVTTSRGWSSPQQVVELDGRVFVPFAGTVPAAGHTPREIEREITARLKGKAHDPQVMVRRVGNASSNVTVLGDVGQSGSYALGARGERLLEVIAAAGGTKQSIGKSVVQLNRDERTYTMPLLQVSKDPRQNVVLRPNDVVTVLFQPYSFTSMGASGNNAEISFESPGFTLAQALGRIGGLQDNRSNVKGVFIFRYEDPSAVDPAISQDAKLTPDGKIPVIYRVNLSEPSALFYAQNFPIRNKDIAYVSNAPLVDFSKFLGIISSTVFSVVGVVNSVP